MELPPNINYFQACELNDVTNRPMGVFHFCCINGKIVYPIGRCRDNNRNIFTKCKHKTAQEANDCYREWEIEKDTKFHNHTNPDLNDNCKECGVETKGAAVVGMREVIIPLCKPHQSAEIVAKHYPKFSTYAPIQ